MTTCNKKRLSIIALTIILCILISAFVSCKGLPATQESEEHTTSHPLINKTEWQDPPDFPAIKDPETIILPDYQTEEPEDSDDEPERVVRYAASSESNKYHRLSCHYVDRIKSYNLVYYYTENEALDDGKSPCSVCSP